MSDSEPDWSTAPSRIVEVFFSFVECGHRITPCDHQVCGSPRCVMSRDGENLVIFVDGACLILSTAELLLLWARFQEWKVRENDPLVFNQFFQDMNRWGEIGVTVIREVVATLMFAEARNEIER